MKLSNRMPDRFKRQSYLEDLTMILLMITTAGIVSLIPLLFTVEFANSAAPHPTQWGEAGLWQELGAKDER